MGTINKAWFINELRKEDRSGRKLAKFLKIDPSSVSRMLAGDRKMTLEEAAQVAKYLEQPLKVVLEQAGIDVSSIVPLRSNMVQVVGTVSAEGIINLNTPKEKPYADAPANVPGGTLALLWNTVMTAQEFCDGWVMYYTPQEGINPLSIGKLSVVEDTEGKMSIRVVKQGHGPNQYRLYAMDGQMKETVSLRSASPVLWIQT